MSGTTQGDNSGNSGSPLQVALISDQLAAAEGLLAVQNAQSPSVAELGRWIATDATSLSTALAAVAASEGQAGPPSNDPSIQDQLAQLQGQQGSGFDQAFLSTVAQQWPQVIAQFQQDASGSNAALATVAQQALPALQAQLDEANGLLAGGAPETTLTPPPSLPAPQPGSAGTLDQQDANFLQTAALGNQLEIAEAQIAVQKAQDPAVGEFARWMITDHTAAGNAIQFLAQEYGVTLPTAPDATGVAMLAKLQSLSGSAFDQTYVTDQVADHAKVINAFATEASTGQNTDVKGFAEQSLPALAQHEAQAVTLAGNQPISVTGPNAGGFFGALSQAFMAVQQQPSLIGDFLGVPAMIAAGQATYDNPLAPPPPDLTMPTPGGSYVLVPPPQGSDSSGAAAIASRLAHA